MLGVCGCGLGWVLEDAKKERDAWPHETTSTATHCNTLQHTATHCNTLQHTERDAWPLETTSLRKRWGLDVNRERGCMWSYVSTEGLGMSFRRHHCPISHYSCTIFHGITLMSEHRHSCIMCLCITPIRYHIPSSFISHCNRISYSFFHRIHTPVWYTGPEREPTVPGACVCVCVKGVISNHSHSCCTRPYHMMEEFMCDMRWASYSIKWKHECHVRLQ